MKELLPKDNNKDMGHRDSKPETSIKANTKKANLTEKVSTHGRMALGTKGNLVMGEEMVKEFGNQVTVHRHRLIKDLTKMTRKTVMEFIDGLMDLITKARS